MKQSADVIIIGGGVIGCLTAYQLSKQGIDVTLLEQQTLGTQASSAATGLLAPFKLLSKPENPYLILQRASLALFPNLAEELQQFTGISVEFHRTGTLRIAQKKQLSRLEAWIALWQQNGVQMQVFSGAALKRQEPALAANQTLAVTIPEEPQVRAPLFTQACAQAAKAQGVTIYEYTQVIGIQQQDEYITAIQTTRGETISCNHVIIATGAWSASCGKLFNLDLPVAPLQGQSILLQQPAQPVRHILFGEGVYLAPKSDNTLIVGATRDHVGFDTQVTSEGIQQLRKAAQNLVPSLTDARMLASWAGLRPRTPDSRPLLGPAPGWQNVTLACGHNGFGILLSPITAQALTELITTGNVPQIIQSFTLNRFSSGSIHTNASTGDAA